MNTLSRRPVEYLKPVLPSSELVCKTESTWASIPEFLSQAEKQALKSEIAELLTARKATLVAHYYVDSDLQDLAEETGGCVSDSLEMARFGRDAAGDNLIVVGVRFMGETSKILNPEKRVFMPDLEATCSLDLGCPPDEFSAFCDQHPDRTVVVYANTSAAVKARADWMVTSSIALDIVSDLARRGEKVLWAPDRHLGDYIQKQTGADMLMWPGSCIVHDEFKAHELRQLREKHPQAMVLVHPESPADVIAQADVVGSTSKLIQAVGTPGVHQFIVATDNGIFHKMNQLHPEKILIEAPTGGKSATCKSCAHCPWMAMNSLRKLRDLLKNGFDSGQGEIHVDSSVGKKAYRCIDRMLAFSSNNTKNLRARGQASFELSHQGVGPA